MAKSEEIRADCLAYRAGLAESHELAKSLIMAGRITLLDAKPGSRPLKPGQKLDPETKLILSPGKIWVSRGAEKLLTLLEDVDLDVNGFVCLDAGASTGGFTDCLLARGARRVYAVDVGKNQLHEKLRVDPRVVSMEGVNLRYAPENLIPEPVDFITGDLSFISLTLVLPACARWLKPGGYAATLIKPQFELSPKEVRKGVVTREEDRQKAVAKIIEFCQNNLNWRLSRVVPSRLKGPKGNQEYVALFESAGL